VLSDDTLDQKDLDLKQTSLILSLTFGIITGFLFSVNSLSLNYISEDLKFEPNQMAQDTNIMMGLIFLPFFIINSVNGKYEVQDILTGFVASIGLTAAIVVLTYALKYGKAANC